MHYLPLSKLQQRHTEVVDNTPAVFLPTKILELTCKVFSYGVEIILPCILFISWCKEEDVKVFHKDFQKKTINHLLMTSRMFQLFLQLDWYETKVQSCDRDEVGLVFVGEPRFVYKIPVLPDLLTGNLCIKKDNYNSSQTDQTIYRLQCA